MACVIPAEVRISLSSPGAKLATGITVYFVVLALISPFSKAIASFRPRASCRRIVPFGFSQIRLDIWKAFLSTARALERRPHATARWFYLSLPLLLSLRIGPLRIHQRAAEKSAAFPAHWCLRFPFGSASSDTERIPAGRNRRAPQSPELSLFPLLRFLSP